MRPKSCPPVLAVQVNMPDNMNLPPIRENWPRIFTRVQTMIKFYQTRIFSKEYLDACAESESPSMISPRTRRIFSFLLFMVQFTYILPWRWDPVSGRIRKIGPFAFKLWRIQALFHIFLRLSLPTYIFTSIAILPIPAYEIFLTIWNIGIQMITVIFLVVVLIPSKEYELRTIANSSFRFNKILNCCKILKAKSKLGPEVENLMVSYTISAYVIMACIGPGIAYMLSKGNFQIGWILDYFQFIPFLYVFVAIFISYFYAMDATILIWTVIGCIMHCVVMSGWLEVLKNEVSDEEISDTDLAIHNRGIQIIFRAHQVLHRHVEEFSYSFVPLLLSIILVVCITVLYSLFGLYTVLNPVVLICCVIIGAIIIGMLKFVCNICGKFTTNSVAYRDSFDRNIHTDKPKVDELFFRSIEPITFHIGPYKEINNSIYQPMLTNVVVNWVINLLLSLERPTGR